MLSMLQFYVRLCFLKVAPQDAPFSKASLYLGLTAYYILGVIFTTLSQTFVVGLIMSAIQLALLVFLTNLLLWVRKTPERYEQTLSALTLSGAFIGLIALPIILMIGGSVSDAGSIASVFWVLLIAWEAVVLGHIFRHSLDISFPGGLGISFIYMYLSFAITLRLMKIIAAPLS